MPNIELDFLSLSGGLSILDAHHSAKLQNGGADRDRTGGLLVANQALSQLSYSPNRSSKFRVSSFE
jgi:hypothetical protein